MKFMKLGSKPDTFQTDSNGMRFVESELAGDIICNVGEVKFCLHKFPILSKSLHLQKLVAAANDENIDEIYIRDIPGGPAAFEICAKFCYGMIVALNAYNVVAVRCAAEYLEMHETVDKGNLIYKIEVFLNTSVFRGWRDSIIVLRTTTSLLPWSENLKLVCQCINAITSKACIDPSKVNWSYTYRKGLKGEQLVPDDWWVEDLSELELNLYERILMAIKGKERLSAKAIGKAIEAYAYKKLPPGFDKGDVMESGNITKNELLFEAVVGLLPSEKGSVSCSFLLKLLKTSRILYCGEKIARDLIKKIAMQLQEAMVSELFFPCHGGNTMYDVEVVVEIVEEFVAIDGKSDDEHRKHKDLLQLVSDSDRIAVGKLIDGYLAEIAKDPNQPMSEFVKLASMISDDARPVHDGLYHAIDLYLMGHPDLSKSEKKKLCSLIHCNKLSPESCAHAIQNERLPLRVVVLVLFFEQVRAAAATGNNCCYAAGELGCASNGSSRSNVTEENIDSGPTADEIKSLKSIMLSDTNGGVGKERRDGYRGSGKVKAIAVPKKLLGKLLSSKGGGSDSSGSPELAKTEEFKATPARNGRHSVS
ncbi:BTB/POZ domain-containing protein NPY2 [Apostasia shenzhenica]|uniref:BTB/POZ domain-containing protein NPY2 n=1 Tax=Apostasia shenzhenica TaxID=1088818 RepID=A0A2I0AWI2_9ASPA|nr:BTB/POZ domain-containing protein NPY2 [Apostasia shenzhenica]